METNSINNSNSPNKEEDKKSNTSKPKSSDNLKRKIEFALKPVNLKKKPTNLPQSGSILSNTLKVSLSKEFKAQHILLHEGDLLAQGHKGYISVLSNFPVIEGCYYYEVKILPPKMPLAYENHLPHVRIGICTKDFKCDYVLGYDNKSYSYRDLDGSVYNEGYSKDYGEAYTIGDTIGCLIYLKPPKPKSIKVEVTSEDEKKFEEINLGSKVVFFKNGVCQGLAFENIIQGFYYMGASLYNHARIKCNFGPHFECIPTGPSEFGDIIKKIKPASCLNEEESRYKDVKIF